MRSRRHNLSLLCLCLLCTTLPSCKGVWRGPPDFNKIWVGMTKSEVIERIGKPTHVSAAGGRELLVYEWDNFWDGKGAGMYSYVGLNAGKVTGYYTDHLRPSDNFNVAEAWTRIQAAPRTDVMIQQNNTAILQSQMNVFR